MLDMAPSASPLWRARRDMPQMPQMLEETIVSGRFEDAVVQKMLSL